MEQSRITLVIQSEGTWWMVLKDGPRTQKYQCHSQQEAEAFALSLGRPVETPVAALRAARCRGRSRVAEAVPRIVVCAGAAKR